MGSGKTVDGGEKGGVCESLEVTPSINISMDNSAYPNSIFRFFKKILFSTLFFCCMKYHEGTYLKYYKYLVKLSNILSTIWKMLLLVKLTSLTNHDLEGQSKIG